MDLLPFRAQLPTLPAGSDATPLFERSKFAYAPTDFRPDDAGPAYYLYHWEQDGFGSRTVLVGLIDLLAWEQHRILPHEETLLDKEEQQIRLTRERGSCVKPVLLTYEDPEALAPFRPWLADTLATVAPAVDLREPAALRHRVYPIRSAHHQSLIRESLRSRLPCVYIADGHHRLKTTYRMWREGSDGAPYRYLLAGLIAPQDLTIYSHQRVVKINPIEAPTLLQKLDSFFQLRRLPAPALPAAAGQWTLFYADHCYELSWKQASGELDVARFNRQVLPEVFGIHQVNTTDNVSYWEGDQSPAALAARVASRPDLMIFCPYPLARAAFFSTVGPGVLLPPKSTRFEPRMPNGLIIQQFADQ